MHTIHISPVRAHLEDRAQGRALHLRGALEAQGLGAHEQPRRQLAPVEEGERLGLGIVFVVVVVVAAAAAGGGGSSGSQGEGWPREAAVRLALLLLLLVLGQ